jgi:hypothetical protein
MTLGEAFELFDANIASDTLWFRFAIAFVRHSKVETAPPHRLQPAVIVPSSFSFAI